MKSTTIDSTVAIANALELARAIISEVVGGDLSDSLDNRALTRDVLYNRCVTQLSNTFAAKLGN